MAIHGCYLDHDGVARKDCCCEGVEDVVVRVVPGYNCAHLQASFTVTELTTTEGSFTGTSIKLILCAIPLQYQRENTTSHCTDMRTATQDTLSLFVAVSVGVTGLMTAVAAAYLTDWMILHSGRLVKHLHRTESTGQLCLDLMVTRGFEQLRIIQEARFPGIACCEQA